MDPDQVIHKGRTSSLVRREVELPTGGRLTVELVRHPGAAAVLPLLGASRLLLIRQFRPALGRWLWEIPAGTLEPGESVVDCARRELLEETGYDAASIREVGHILPVPDFSDDLIHVFVARDLRYRGQELENDEVIETVPIHVRRAIGMIKDGQITDAKTLISILLLVGLDPRCRTQAVPSVLAAHKAVVGSCVRLRDGSRRARRVYNL